MDPQAVAQQAQTASKSNNISGLQNVATKYATSAVLNYVNNREAAAVMNSRQDQQTWQDNAAKFLSPNSDIKPDLDAYLRTQPLATDALSESTLTGGNMSKTAGGRGALGVLSGGLSALMPSGEAEYAFNKGGEGAAQGAVAGGWVGAIVGGVVGVAEGIVGWGDASAKDNAQRQTARDEFLQAMKVWQDQQNKKLYAMRTQAQGQSETSARNYDIAAKSANAPDEKKRLQSLYFQQNLFDNLLLGGKLAA
jgi:hypothetical protein